ncbi:DUF3137 domain-containing protein, partial [bacterium]|nr:DUF3137 domain-containing protein [bacterium]
KEEVFKGVIINFKINKNVKNRTIVTTKKNKTAQHVPIVSYIVLIILLLAVWNAFGIFGKIISVAFGLYVIYYDLFVDKTKEKFQKVVLEDLDFNKIFNVYSSDQVEARYLVTTSFMERFKNLQDNFGAKVVKCSFYDNNKLMIAISTNKDLFEIGCLYKSFYDKTYLKQFYKELSSIYFLIDYFKLDEDTKL